jgi:cytochrome c2
MPGLRALAYRRLRSAAALALLVCTLAACAKPTTADTGAASGDATAGAALIVKLGCGSCHDIPGIVDANGLVGPPLGRVASRQYIAGVLRNTPDNMVQWLRFPQQIVPGNAMPDLAISDHDARQIAAYLATLK